MPANLSPEYRNAEAAFRAARDPRERLESLREMLRTIPKHKGTDHLQADIKTRIKNLTEELSSSKKTGARGGPPLVIRPEGTAQVALVGAPNVGKSSLHDRLTGSHAEAGPYPYTTPFPLPGMLPYEDIHFQLVDLPPISRDHPVPWIGNTLQLADASLLMVDLQEPASVDDLQTVLDVLAERRVTLVGEGEESGPAAGGAEGPTDPFRVRLPTLLVATKSDLSGSLRAEIEALQALVSVSYPFVEVSVKTGAGLDRIGPWLFETLGIVRVYTKSPGRQRDTGPPFTVRRGATVQDVALLVHKDVAGSFKHARLWGSGQFDGQQVGRDHPVSDGDLLELHA